MSQRTIPFRNQLVSHTVVNVQEVMRIAAGVLHQLGGEWADTPVSQLVLLVRRDVAVMLQQIRKGELRVLCYNVREEPEASGEMRSQPNISLKTRTTLQKTEYVSHVSKGTRSCASLPMCCRFFVRQRERTRWPGLVRVTG